MKKAYLNIGILGLMVLLFASCKREDSSLVDQNRIYMDLSYTYYGGSNTASASAEFRVNDANGRKIELSYPSLVKFNDQVMSWQKLTGNYRTANFISSNGGTFEFQDHDGNQYYNKAYAVKLAELPIGLDRISKNADLYIPWQGESVQPGDELKITIKAGVTETFRTTQTGSTFIRIEHRHLEDLIPGEGTIEIQRVNTIGVSQGTDSGGIITLTYKGRVRDIEVVE